MTALPGDFEDDSEEEPSRPALPPEDRLWRHPSELDPLAIDPAAVRRHWLLSHPSRRSVLTAGIVGALLATGVVAVATHLADALGSPSHLTSNNPVRATALKTPAAAPTLSASLRTSVDQVAGAMATVRAADRDGATTQALGIVIRPDGTLLVPSIDVLGAKSLIVTLANGDVYVGSVVGSDPTSGISVVHINGVTGLSTVAFSHAPLANDSFALAVTTPGQHTYSLGTIQAVGAAAQVGHITLVGAMPTSLPVTLDPVGSPLLSTNGTVEGIVTGSMNDAAVIAPAWLASSVANDLMAMGTVVHGWLGIRCETNPTSPVGVRIVAMMRTGALSRAGLRVGDVIVSVNDTSVNNLAQLQAQLYALTPGTHVELGIDHDGKLATHTVGLAASPTK